MELDNNKFDFYVDLTDDESVTSSDSEVDYYDNKFKLGDNKFIYKPLEVYSVRQIGYRDFNNNHIIEKPHYDESYEIFSNDSSENFESNEQLSNMEVFQSSVEYELPEVNRLEMNCHILTSSKLDQLSQSKLEEKEKRLNNSLKLNGNGFLRTKSVETQSLDNSNLLKDVPIELLLLYIEGKKSAEEIIKMKNIQKSKKHKKKRNLKSKSNDKLSKDCSSVERSSESAKALENSPVRSIELDDLQLDKDNIVVDYKEKDENCENSNTCNIINIQDIEENIMLNRENEDFKRDNSNVFIENEGENDTDEIIVSNSLIEEDSSILGYEVAQSGNDKDLGTFITVENSYNIKESSLKDEDSSIIRYEASSDEQILCKASEYSSSDDIQLNQISSETNEAGLTEILDLKRYKFNFLQKPNAEIGKDFDIYKLLKFAAEKYLKVPLETTETFCVPHSEEFCSARIINEAWQYQVCRCHKPMTIQVNNDSKLLQCSHFWENTICKAQNMRKLEKSCLIPNYASFLSNQWLKFCEEFTMFAIMNQINFS